jgi:hypothetical protein
MEFLNIDPAKNIFDLFAFYIDNQVHDETIQLTLERIKRDIEGDGNEIEEEDEFEDSV